MKKVLVIAYYFPPMGMAGVQRTLKFVKYLHDYNWKPTVLTIAPGAYYAKDYSLLNELEGKDIEILRVQTMMEPTQMLKNKEVLDIPKESHRKILSRLSQVFLLPDNKIGWKKKAIELAENYIEKENIDVIYSTAPPYTDFLIGVELKKKFHLPLVFDYRDAWVDNPYNFYATPFHKMMSIKMERKALHESDHIITINRRIKELLISRYSFLKYNDITILSQGFDPVDFNDDETATLPKVNKFRITYSGTFIDRRTPIYFLTAVDKLLKENPEMRNDFEACFLGHFRKENEKIVKKLKLQDVVNIVGYVDHKECIKYLKTSDVLWLIIGKGKGDEMMSTGKLFEYIGARKTILGCVPEGVAKNTILESNAGIVTEPNDSNAIAEAIYKLYKMYKKKQLPKPPDDFVDKFDRNKLTGELSKIFELLTDYSTFHRT
jgi:glycosyltransferase involved in cell wall biosynthesis